MSKAGKEDGDKEEHRPWHHLFVLSWEDFFTDTPVKVRPEEDVSRKKQLIDLILLRDAPVELTREMPDGFEPLAANTLITFKSFREPLNEWSILELIGHYVNYRKQASPDMNDLLPEDDFRLLAVSTRYPRDLAGELPLTKVSEGVFDAKVVGKALRVIVIGQLPCTPNNAMLHLFSADAEARQYGVANAKVHSPQTSTLLYQLFAQYQLEKFPMPENLQEFAERTINKMLAELPIEKRLEGLPPEKIAERLTPEQRLEGLPAEKRLEGLPAEKRLEGLSPDALFDALSPEARESLAQRLRDSSKSPAKPE